MAATRYLAMHPSAEETASGNSPGYDVDRMRSGVFFLSVTACAGGADTLDVKIQDSPDGSVWYDLLTFTQATAATTERKPTTTPIGRYVRAVWTLGAGTTATFSINGCLNEA